MTEYSKTLRNRRRKLRFVRRIHGMRMLGTALCALPIGSVLAEREASLAVWLLVGGNALLWPQIAHCLSMRARSGCRAVALPGPGFGVHGHVDRLHGGECRADRAVRHHGDGGQDRGGRKAAAGTVDGCARLRLPAHLD